MAASGEIPMAAVTVHPKGSDAAFARDVGPLFPFTLPVPTDDGTGFVR